MKASEVWKKLEKAGMIYWEGGSHRMYVYPDVKMKPIPVSRHKSQEIATGTLKKILKLAGLE